MRNDERLRTIYEVMAPYIVRNEHNWRDYLAFASQFHKHSFDNILLVYAQDEDVSILATRKQWATIGRNLIPRAKGVAVCVYRNAKLTLDYLFDVSQTTGKEIHPTDWQLSDEMKKALTERLSYAHGFPKQDFPQALYAMASESVAENYNHFLQELKQETKGHLFTEIPAGGFEAQYIQLLTDSISYFIGKKCHLSDEEIQLSDGMATVSHFNTLPLVAHLGTAVTALSKGILLEVERNIKIINRERMAQHEQTEYQSEIQGAGRDDASRSANLQQQRSRSTSGQVRPDGPGIPQRESPGAIYDFENGWQSDGDHAPGTGRGDREDRSPDAANAPAGAASADRGHHGADATPEQSETDGGGNRTPERSPDSPLTEEQPNTEVAPSAAPVGEPSEKDGSFSVPAEQPTRHFTDAEVRRNYEYILTSPNLYPPELHSAVRSVLSEPPLNPDWSDKGRQIAALFTPYGDREYQGDFLYRTRLHGEDGISFFFDEGYTYIPWNGLAFLLDAMIEDGDYPNPVVEEQPDPIGDYNIPDEVDEMGGPHRQMTIGEADFDYVLDAVAYEAGETVVEPVKPQAIVQMENDTPAAGDEPASVPDENPPVVVEAPETALPTDTAEQPTPPPVKENTTAHKNFRRFQELFPEIVSGQYEYLRLEAGEAYYPLVIHHKYGSHYCMEHYYMQNGDRMYDPYMDFQIDKEAGTLRAFSYENSGIGVYNEADPDDPAYDNQAGGSLRKTMTSLTHKNLPLAMFLEYADMGFPAYTGATNKTCSNDTIITYLGMGIVWFTDPPEQPEPTDYDYEYRVDTDVITPVTLYAGSEINPDSPATVSFSINGSTYRMNNIVIPSGDSQIAWVKWHTPSEPQDITIYVSTNKGSLSQSTIHAKVVDLSGNDPPDPKATDTMGSWSASSIPSRETKTYAAWSVWWAKWHPYWVWHSTGKNTGYWVDDGWYDYFRDNYSASMTATTRIEPDEKVPTASGDLMKSGYGVTNTVTATVSTSAPLSHYSGGHRPLADRWGG